MMQMGKLILLMFSVVAIGTFALPSVLSLGDGQHTFINGQNVDCNKCHNNVNDKVKVELDASNPSLYAQNVGGLGSVPAGTIIHKLGANANGIQACKDCHTPSTGTLAVNDISGNTQHTGILMKPICVSCHNGIDNELNNNTEPHKGFYTAAVGSSDENLACMGCHTAVQVTGSPSYAYSTGTVLVDGLTIGGVAGP